MNRQVPRLFLALLFVFGLTSCQCHYSTVDPVITYTPSEEEIRNINPCFEPLSLDEECSDWGKEEIIGLSFAKELDFYRAITAFKRALILIPEGHPRHAEIEYQILLCYYLGLKYEEALVFFEKSSLISARSSFPGYRTLLITLYDCYQKTGNPENAEKVLEVIEKHESGLAHDLKLCTLVEHGEIIELHSIEPKYTDKPGLNSFLCCYETGELNPTTARALNAILPGAGYYYVGQTRSAITSFLLNTLFIWATVHFFENGNIPAGIITASFEVGWYFGGINGAGLAAKEYNDSIYSCYGKEFLVCERLFPALMFSCAF